MVLFVNALGGQASFTISLAALTPVTGVSWTYTGLPATAGSGVSFRSSDDSGITFTAFRGFINNLSSMTVRATLENSTTAVATFDISSGSGAILPAINTLVELGVTSGLVAQYDPPSWNGTTKVWSDKSGNGNNTSPADVRGAITYDTTNGFLYGGPSDGLKFPALGTTANYTFIHLARYKDGTKQRIFQGVTENWASGFYDGKSGVAFHNGYITAPTDLYGYNWVISSDQRNLYRAHSINFTNGTAGSPGYPTRIGLNFGAATSEYSDWAVAEVLIYNRVLTSTEMLSVENYLRAKYPSLTIQIDTTIGASFTIPQSNYTLSVGSVNWTYKTPLPAGVTFTGSTQIGAAFSIATGTFINNENMVVNASGNGGGGTRSLYLLAASRALLDTPNVTFDTSDPGSFTVLQTASGTGGVTWAYTNLPASVTFLSSSDAGLTFEVAQNAVVPTRTLTVTATNGLKTPTFASFTYGSGVKPVLSVGVVSAIDSTSSSTFLVPQIVVDAFTGGITWSYYPPIFPAGLTVSTSAFLTNNQGVTFIVAQNAVIAQQTITVTATNIGGVATSISFVVGAAVKPVLGFTNQLLNTSATFKQFTVTVQAPSVTFSGGITWSYTLPTGLTFVTSSNGLITFQAARGTVITSQTFVVTATNSIGTPTAASFTVGAGTPPTLSDPTNGSGELIIDTGVINRTFAVDQESRRTGTISWTVSPSTYPAGISIQASPNVDFGITLLLLVGSVLPYQPFVFTATAASGFVVTRTFNVGGSSLVELQGPGDPKLIDTTTQQTLTVSQIYDPTYTGPVTWTITPSSYPAGISITTQDDYETIFTFNANSYLTRQQFVFTAQSIGGLTDTIQFDVGAAVRPTLGNLANQVLDTSTALKTFAVAQQVNPAYTGPIAWTVTPSPFPSGSGMSQVTTDGLITFMVPVQTASTGVVWPNTPFSVTATNINTGYSSFVPTTFDVFAPRLPVVNVVTPSSRILDVSTAAYTLITATQSKTDAVPVVWSITQGDNTAVPAGVSINSSSGLVTIAATSYFTATVLKAIATNSAGAFGSTTFVVTTPAPPAINTVTPSTPQVLDVSDGSQTLTFALTNSGLAGTVVWAYTPLTAGVTINSGTGDFAIAQYTYFTATSFTIKAKNAANVTTQRIVTVTTPAVPTVTSPTVSPQVLQVTTQSRTIQFTQSTALVGAVTWSYTPTTSGVTINSSGLLTIAQGTYFAATDFTIKATNVVTKFGTMVMNITTPAPPVIDTVSPASGQNIDVSSGAQTLTFTNTAPLTGALAWSYTTTRSGVTIGQGTGVFEIAQGTYFIATTFVIRVVNPVGTANTRSFTVTTPAPPIITGPAVPPGLGARVVPGAGTGGVPRVYVNNTVAFKTVTIAQTASLTGLITWDGITGLPAGVAISAQSNSALTFRIETTAVLRPAASAFARANKATNLAGKDSSTISYDVFTPLTPALGTPSPAPVPLPNGKIILDTSSASQTITIQQTNAVADTDPLIWTVNFGGSVVNILSGNSTTIGTAIVTASDTQLTTSLPVGTFVPDNTPVSVSVMNRADMSSALTSFDLFVPQLAVITDVNDTGFTGTLNTAAVDLYLNTIGSTGATFYVSQSKASAESDITWTTSTLPASITYEVTATTIAPGGVVTFGGLKFTVAQGTVITSPGQTITVTATNGAGVSASRTFIIYAGNPPVVTTITSFTGTIAATTLTVTGTVTGTIASGTTLSGIGVTAGTMINGQLTGTYGGAGTYTVSVSQTVSTPTSMSTSAAANFVVDTTPGITYITVTNSGGAVETWDNPVNFVFPIGVSFSSSTGSTYVIAVAQNSIFGTSAITVTGKNQFSPAGSSVTFSVAGNKAPVVTTPGTQNFNTTTAGGSFTVSQTSGGTGIVWSSNAPPSITLSASTTTSALATFNILQTTALAATNIVVTATNIAGTTSTAAFSVAAFFYVAPTVNVIGNYPIIDSTSGYSFVTATLDNSQSAGPVSWSIVSAPAGISINSSSGAISIAQGTVITGDTVTIRATNAAGTDDAAFIVAANVKPVLLNELGDNLNWNTNTIGGAGAMITVGSVLATAGTNISFTFALTGNPPSVVTRGKRYSTTGEDITAPPSLVSSISGSRIVFTLNKGCIFDSGTQGVYGTIGVTAANAGGSTTITLNLMAYPYILTNWNASPVFPNGYFYIDFPYKASNQTNKHWTTGILVSGALRLATTSADQINASGLTYNYRLNRIISNFGGYEGWALVGQLDGGGRFNYFQNTALANYSYNPGTNIAANPQWMTWDFTFFRPPGLSPQGFVYGVWSVDALADKYLDSGGDSGNYTVQYQVTIDVNGDFFGNQRAQNKSRLT